MKNYKIFVGNEEMSKKVQEHAFKLGYDWLLTRLASPNKIIGEDKAYLFMDDQGNLTCGDSYAYFEGHGYPEITITDFLAIKPESKIGDLVIGYDADELGEDNEWGIGYLLIVKEENSCPFTVGTEIYAHIKPYKMGDPIPAFVEED